MKVLLFKMKSFLILMLYTYSLNSSPLSSRLNKSWWKYTEIYALNVWTFKDDNGDGFGDLKGLISKLDYIHELGITTIQLSSIFSSRSELIFKYGNMGYSTEYDGITNFTDIHKTIGTLDDFDDLVRTARSKNIKIILDLPLTDCSTNHPWFELSRESVPPYIDYFIWTNGYREHENDYWQYDYTRRQLFLIEKETQMLVFNFRNTAMKEEVKKIIKFWFDRGVSGLNLLSVEFYVKHQYVAWRSDIPLEWMRDLPESYEFVHELREYVDAYNKENGGYEREFIALPVWISMDRTIPTHYRPDQAKYGIYYYTSSFQQQVAQHIRNELESGPTLFIYEDQYTNERLAYRIEFRETFDVWILFTYLCPGTLHIYYGQEIALNDWKIQYEFYELYYNGNSMQWDDSLNAGFTTNKSPNIPPNSDYWRVNAELAKNTTFSTYHMVRDLLELRKTVAGKYGDFRTQIISRWIYAVIRSYRDKETYLMVLNLENVNNKVDLKSILNDLPDKVMVVASTPNSLLHKGDEINTTSITVLAPLSGIVVVIRA